MPLLDSDDFYPGVKMFTPFTPPVRNLPHPNLRFDKSTNCSFSAKIPWFCAESGIKSFQRKVPPDLTIPYKSAKIYLHKGTADRRLVRIWANKNSRLSFADRGGYFCGLLLSLLPMAYPRPKQVRHKPSTEINPSIVNIHLALLSQIPASRFLCNRRVTVPP